MKRLLNILRVLGLLILFLIAYTWTSDVLMKKEHKNNTVADFYKEPKDSVDVVFLGTSHTYQAFSPMELWEKEGITSYNLGTSSQPLPASYYLMKEAIRTQHPKVIVVEAHGMKYEKLDEDLLAARLHMAFDGMPLNATKMEICRDYLLRTLNMDRKKVLGILFPISLYHDRWSELTKRDFEPKEPFTKGFLLIKSRIKLQKPVLVTENASWDEIDETILPYIHKMIQLCEQNQVKLVFCQVPLGYDLGYAMIQRKVNALFSYAQAEGITCINFQNMLDELDIDYEKDFVNEGHLNIRGAEKINTYMAAYLKEEYLLPDHRDDEAYAAWKEDAKKYRNRKKRFLK